MEALIATLVTAAGVVAAVLLRRHARVTVEVNEDGEAFILGVFQEAAGTWAGACSCSFLTKGWASEDQAAHRLAQHEVEHQTGQPMDAVVNVGSIVGRLG